MALPERPRSGWRTVRRHPKSSPVHAIRYQATMAAVEECANGTERLVVLTLGEGGWAVSHVIGADTVDD